MQGKGDMEESFQSCGFKGQRMPLSGRPLRFPLAWVQGDQADGSEWHDVKWGSDVTWKRFYVLGGH